MQRKRDRSTLELPWPAPDLKPGDDRLEPRLWIRRLRLWHDFGDDNPEHGRTVEFRRGLNIISSPASSTAEHVPTGHAAGKTLLCRQIRYCLGEDTFADPDDTGTIRSILKSGGVGAEVRLCGETWVVRRAFNSRADDRAMRGERIEELGDDSHRDTYGAFRTAIEAFAFTDAHRGLLNELGDVEVPWQYLLAWLTRDQECRLDGLTHWRHPDSSSHSPVRKAPAETRLNVLRIALGLYSEQSNAARRRISAASQILSAAESVARQCDERFKVLRKDLASVLRRDDAEIWPPPPQELLQDEQIAREAHVRWLEGLIDQRLRSVSILQVTPAQKADEQALEDARAEFAEIEHRIRTQSDTVQLVKNQLGLISTDSAKAGDDLRRAKHPICPYDDTPLDVEKLKFVCPLPRLPDPEVSRKIAQDLEVRRNEVADEVASQESALGKLKGRSAGLATRITHLNRSVEAHQLAITRATLASQTAWAAKSTLRNLVDSTKALDDARAAEKQAKETEKTILEQKNEHLSSYSTTELTKWFDVLVKRIVAREATGEIKFDGKGIQAIIEWRGRRRSVALNSLRLVLFDFAAMLCAVEGSSSAPAFLLHDSPREGDLDPWTYARLFETAFAFGPDDMTAPFQYIVTTTTEPPGGDIRQRVRTELSAHSDATRFFRVDL